MILDVSDAFSGLTQSVALTVRTTTTVDFEPIISDEVTNIMAVIQPEKHEDLKVETVDWSKQYIRIHSISEININNFIDWNGKKYKIVTAGNYTGYGYFEAIGEEYK